MLRWIILIFIGYLIYRFLRGFLSSPKLPKRNPPQEIQDEMVQDPVCQVYIPKRQAVVLHDSNGAIHYFCSTECREKFIQKKKRKASS
jgi:YHS domain-containing protein